MSYLVNPYMVIPPASLKTCEQLNVSGYEPVANPSISTGSRRGIEVSDGFTCLDGEIRKVIFKMKEAGNAPAGTYAYCNVYDSDGTTVECTVGYLSSGAGILATSLSGIATDYTFEYPDKAYTLKDGDFIALAYPEGEVGGYIEFAVAVGTAVSNSAYANYNGSVWNTNSSNSVYYKIESFG